MKQFSKLIVLLSLILFACSSGSTKTSTPTRLVDPTGTGIPAQAVAPQSLVTPQPTTTANPTSTHPPSPTPTTEENDTPPSKVFLISWDAGQAGLVYDMMAAGLLPNFANLAKNGVRAEYALTVDPSLTASAHSSISTGSYPNRTGIVSNAFHNPNDSFYWYRQGFFEPLDDAEPVWVTASRAGLTSAALFFPGGSPAFPAQTADYTIGYGERDAYSSQVTIKMAPSNDDWVGTAPESFSPPHQGSFVIPEVARVFVYLYDPTDDGVPNHDAVLLSTERRFDPDISVVHVDQWIPVMLVQPTLSGADFLVQNIDLEGVTPEVTLFHSAVYHNTAAPRELLEALNDIFGFFPAGADSYALEHGWITDEDYLAMLERSSAWMAEVSAWVYSTYQPDLLMTWQNTFDSAGHAWFLKDERQPDYSPEKAAKYAEYVTRAAAAADRDLDTMLDVIDLEQTTLMMVSDHGMAPVHTKVYVNTVLEWAGLLRLDNRNYVDVDRSRAFAVVSGGAVHVYINLVDHERDGFVSPEVYFDVQAQIVESLVSLTDPDTGELVFQRVLSQDELNTINLDHPNAGDVFAQVNPGYVLDGWRGKNHIFEPVSYYGQHGYDSALPEMHGLFIAAGAGVPRTGEVLPPVSVVDYASTIAHILGFETAPTVDGSPILALINHK